MINSFENKPYTVIKGTAGRDRLTGSDLNEWFQTGTGNDRILDLAGDNLFDTGAGSDRVKAGGGNDVFLHNRKENIGSHDVYDGGAGTDTLILKLSGQEWARRDVQKDIAEFLQLVASRQYANLTALGLAPEFEFSSMDLVIRRIEKLRVFVEEREIANLANEKADARDDTFIIAGRTASIDLLKNDVAPDRAASIELLETGKTDSLTFKYGTLHLKNELNAADQSSVLTFVGNSAYDALKEGEKAPGFALTYRLRDVDGDKDEAKVAVEIVGVNDAPTLRAQALRVSQTDKVVKVATFSLSDADTSADIALRVLNASGIAVDERFEIRLAQGSQATFGAPGNYEVVLKTGVVLDFTQTPTVSFLIEANDGEKANNLGRSELITLTAQGPEPVYSASFNKDTVIEGETITLTVLREGADLSKAGSVKLNFAGLGNPPALFGPDYAYVRPLTDNVVQFAPNEAVKTVRLTVIDDRVTEGREEAVVVLSDIVGGGALKPNFDKPSFIVLDRAPSPPPTDHSAIPDAGGVLDHVFGPTGWTP